MTSFGTKRGVFSTTIFSKLSYSIEGGSSIIWVWPMPKTFRFLKFLIRPLSSVKGFMFSTSSYRDALECLEVKNSFGMSEILFIIARNTLWRCGISAWLIWLLTSVLDNLWYWLETSQSCLMRHLVLLGWRTLWSPTPYQSYLSCSCLDWETYIFCHELFGQFYLHKLWRCLQLAVWEPCEEIVSQIQDPYLDILQVIPAVLSSDTKLHI